MSEAVVVWNSSYIQMMSSLKRYVSRLQGTLPLDQLGRVTALVDPQVVLATGFCTPLDNFLDAPPEGAVVSVSYLEGLPTILGAPIWELLEGEKLEFYELFKRYRSMKDAKTQRAVYKLALESNLEVKHLETLRQIYHWNVRVAAYDEYVQKERAVQLELRRIEIEGKHAHTASTLFNISSKYLEEHPELLTPKLALQMLDVAVKLERLSAGMITEGRQLAGDRSAAVVNIQNNVAADRSPTEPKLVTNSNEENRQRLTQVLNVMNSIGLIKNPELDVMGVDEIGEIPEE